MNRREFLTLAAAQLAACIVVPAQLSMPDIRLVFNPQNQEPNGDVLVCIFQRGGMDGLNAVIPYGEAKNYYDQRPSLAVQAPSSGSAQSILDLDGFFGLNPALAPLKDIWDDHALAIVHACGSPDPTHSHFDAMDYMERGTPGQKQITTGWLSRHLSAMATQNQTPFRAVGVAPMLPSSLRGPVSATALESIATFHLGGARSNPQLASFQAGLARLYAGGGLLAQESNLTFQAMETLAKVNPGAYVPAGAAKYPQTAFGNGLKQIAELIKAGLGMEVATLDIGGWDTHVDQGSTDGYLPALMTDLAGGILAFYQDLGDLFKRVTLVTMSEFGRRVQENGSAGTDHGHGNVMFVVSRNILGSKVYGQWPGLAPDKLVTPGDLAVTTDFRAVLAEILAQRVGNPQLQNVFPAFDLSQSVHIFK